THTCEQGSESGFSAARAAFQQQTLAGLNRQTTPAEHGFAAFRVAEDNVLHFHPFVLAIRLSGVRGKHEQGRAYDLWTGSRLEEVGYLFPGNGCVRNVP